MKNNKGYTLIELMTVLMILAVIAGLGIPNIHKWILNQQVNTAARSIAGAFMLARVSAIKHRAPVVVEFYESSGLIRVFIDDGGDDISKAGNNIYDSGETLLKKLFIGDNVSMENVQFARSIPAGSTATDITCFDTLGLTIGSNGSVSVKNTIGTQKKICLNFAGNSRIENI